MAELAPSGSRWFVYVLRCRGDRLYCGVTTDVDRRVDAHRSGRGARFTRAFPPEAVVGVKAVASRSGALKQEASFKRLSRPEKLRTIETWGNGSCGKGSEDAD